MKECKWYCCCPIRRFTEKGMLEKKWVEEYCLGGGWPNCVRYQMEQRGEPHPDNMLPDGSIREDLG